MPKVTPDEIERAIRTDLTVPLWPHVGCVLKMSKNTVYEGARSGEIPSIRVGRNVRVPTAALRKMLGVEPVTAASSIRSVAPASSSKGAQVAA